MKQRLTFLIVLLLCLIGVQKTQAWTGVAPAAGNYYLYNVGQQTFLCEGASGSYASKNIGDATLFTITSGSSSSFKYTRENTTYYLYQDNGDNKQSTKSLTWTIKSYNSGYQLYSKTKIDQRNRYLNAYSETGISNIKSEYDTDNATWLFIPENYQEMVLKSSLSGITVDGWKTYNGTKAGLFNNGGTIDHPYSESFQRVGTPTGEYLTINISDLPNGRYSLNMNACASSTSERDNGGTTLIDKNDRYSYASVHANNAWLPMKAYNQTECANPETYELNNIQVTDGTMKVYINIDKANVNWVIAFINSITYESPYYELLPANAVDYTSWIANPDFANNNATGWSGTGLRFETFKNAEHYNKTYDTYQTVTGLPNGYYMVKVQGLYRNSASIQKATLYANGAYSNIKLLTSENPAVTPGDMATAKDAFDDGNYTDNSVIAYVYNGNLKIGVKKESTTGDDWSIFDYFRLYYLGKTNDETNVTNHIYNPSFEMQSMDGWSYVNGNESGAKENTGDYAMTDGDGSFLYNTWGVTPLYASQTISGLPSGVYELTAVIASDNGNQITISVGDKSKTFTTTDKGTGTTVTLNKILITEGSTPTLDVRSNKWFKVDNFQLRYVEAVAVNYEVLSGTIKKAEALNTILGSHAVTDKIVEAKTMINELTAASQDDVDNLIADLNKLVGWTPSRVETFDNNPNFLKDGTKQGDAAYRNSGNASEIYSYVIDGWTYTSTVGNNAVFAATGEYGSGATLNAVTPPSKDMYGKTNGAAMGIGAGWTDISKYKKTIENLPAGEYVVYYEAYNQNTATTIAANLIGLNGVNSTLTTFPNGTWTTAAFKLTIHDGGNFEVTVGMSGTGSSNNNAKLWIDNLTLYKISGEVAAQTYLTDGSEIYLKTNTGELYINNAAGLDANGALFVVHNTDLNETTLELKGAPGKYLFFNHEVGGTKDNYGVYANGTIPPAKDTHWPYWIIKETTGGYTIYNIMYDKYLVVDANGKLTKGDTPYVWITENESQRVMNPGMDFTSRIVNPGFETGNLTGWTSIASDDTDAKPTNNATYKAFGSEGNYLFNTWKKGTPISQSLALPTGVYELSAMLATGDNENSRGTVYLFAGDKHSEGMISRNGNKGVMRKETVTFISDGSTISIGAVGGNTADGSFLAEGGWWYKADDFKLTYLESTANLFSVLTNLLAKTEPWSDGDYKTHYETYCTYTESTSADDILAAINYLNTKFDDYAWDNASIDHPYLMTNVIKGAEMNDNTYWPGDGRLNRENMNDHWSGQTRTYFVQNTENTYARTQDIVVPFAGKYLLKTAVRVKVQNAYATIKMGDIESTNDTPTGTTGGNVNIDGTEGENNRANNNVGYGWVFNKLEYVAPHDLTATQIGIKLSRVDNNYSGHEANAGGMFLYYIGDKFDYVKNKVHYYHGAWGDTNAELTETVPVLDVTKATGTFKVNATNPNGLVYTSGATINGVTNNIVSNGICADLVLVDGNNFHAHKQFEATNARYTMSSIAVKPNGNKFGTLMIPFAATNKPVGCKIYTLDQDMNLAAEILATSTDAIAANKPVLVTESGAYTASNVNIAATTAGTYSNGHLTGTYTATTASEGTYVLQKHDYTDPEDNTWTIAFFLVGNNTETPIKPTVKPFRAYINKLNGASVKAINIIFEDDVETAIESAPASQERETVIYDLSGRRVQNVQRGIYIINGKKILK